MATSSFNIGDLNSDIAALNSKTVDYLALGGCASASALGTALDSVLANMGNRTSQQVYFYPTVAFSGFVTNVNYFGTLRRSGSATSATVDFYPAWNALPIVGTRDGTNGWVFNALALNSILDNYMPSRKEAGTQPTTIDTLKNGLVYVSSTSQGVPVNYCVVMAFSVASYAFQMAFAANSSAAYLRGGNIGSSSITWSAWKQFST